MTTNIVRRTERGGTSSQAAASVLMENELGVLNDVKKLIVGDGNKAGGYTLTPDNVVSVWPDQAEASSPLSLAWWINRADGSAIKLRLPAGTYNVLNDLTVPANVYLEIDNGAVFNVAAGKTLTLDCEVDVWVVTNIGGGTVRDAARRHCVPNENLIRHNPSCWVRGRMALSPAEGGVGKEYINTITQISNLLYKGKIPVSAGEIYTIKAYGPARCRLYFYVEAESQPAPAHYEHWEDIELFDDTFISMLLWGSTKGDRERLPSGYTFTVPSGATYMRLDSYVLNAAGTSTLTTSLFDLGVTHLYKLEKGSVATAFTPSPQDCNVENAYSRKNNERPFNDPVAARQLVACMRSYTKDRNWIYSRRQTEDENLEYDFKGPADDHLFTISDVDENGNAIACQKCLDCATPVKLAVAGIPYWQSRYEQLTNRWRGTKFYPWGKYQDFSRSSGLQEWIYKNGWEIDPGKNYNKLQAGDLVFWRSTPYKGEWPVFKHGFRSWDHVAMFTGRWVTSSSVDEADGRTHPECLESGAWSVAAEKPDGTKIMRSGVRTRFLDRLDSSDTGHLTTSSPSTECMFARIPLESPYAEFDTADGHCNCLDGATHTDSNNMIYSAGYNPTVYIEGNVSTGDLHINIYGKNAAVWEINGIDSATGMETENSKRVRSGFMPASWMTQNFISSTDALDWGKNMESRFYLICRYFYNGNLSPISTLGSSRSGNIPPNAKYVRYCYGVSSNADDFTPYELAGFNTFIGVQPDVTKTVGAVVDGEVKVTGQTKPRLAYDVTRAYYDGVSNSAAKYRAFSQGYHSYVHIPLSELPLNGAQTYVIGATNGHYSISTGAGWVPLSTALHNKLKALRIADGENFIYIPNGQNVIFSRAVL